MIHTVSGVSIGTRCYQVRTNYNINRQRHTNAVHIHSEASLLKRSRFNRIATPK